jgi:hypothetical protein
VLHEAALQNIARYRAGEQQCRAIEPVCMDCLDYQFPDENIVIYMYHPFAANVLREVLERIAQAFSRSSRDIYILYLSPFHERAFRERADFVEVGGCQVMRFDHSWVVYKYRR